MVDQIALRGGTFTMGSDAHYRDEGPTRSKTVEPFAIDARPVTNDDFAVFVAETGYVTLAERALNADDYPGAPPENLQPGSMVFTMTPRPVELRNYAQWWRWVTGADWRHPTGPESTVEGSGDHPVVHVAWEDVEAYASWAGKEVPTEAEWEFAARGGLEGAEFTWGEGDPQETDNPKANTWQGRFPTENTEQDGWVRTSPVGIYEPNGYGLYDMAGNVWEWTKDFYHNPSLDGGSSCCTADRPSAAAASVDPAQPDFPIPRKVIKGGSHLCTTQYCFRYRPAARQPQMIDTSTSHLGFRLITR